MSSFMTLHKQPPIPVGEEYPLYTRVHVETTSYCNRSCSFCPISTGRRDFFQSMDDDLYKKICDEFAYEKFSGFVALFLLNEPLLDKKLLERGRMMREACPRSTIYVSTNADVLTASKDPVGRLRQIFDSGINSVNLNAYDAGTEQLEQLESIAKDACMSGLCQRHWNKYRKVGSSQNYVAVTDMRPDRPVADQFYDVITPKNKEVRGEVTAPQTYCPRPARDVTIRYDGAFLMCCAVDSTDPDVPIAGWVQDSSIREIWNGDMMRRYRYYLQDKRRVLPACSTCKQRVAYSHAFRRIEATEEEQERWKEFEQ